MLVGWIDIIYVGVGVVVGVRIEAGVVYCWYNGSKQRRESCVIFVVLFRIRTISLLVSFLYARTRLIYFPLSSLSDIHERIRASSSFYILFGILARMYVCMVLIYNGLITRLLIDLFNHLSTYTYLPVQISRPIIYIPPTYLRLPRYSEQRPASRYNILPILLQHNTALHNNIHNPSQPPSPRSENLLVMDIHRSIHSSAARVRLGDDGG